MSALDGVIEVGDVVWQQMYDPQHPAWHAMLAERIARGKTYGDRRQMRVLGIWPYEGTPCAACTGCGRRLDHSPCPACSGTGVIHRPHTTVKWMLAEVGREGDHSTYSWVDDNWCVLEHVVTEGALF
ncbi:hypothetical protein [Herbiconiux sp.]|uniref:hypothetical protein n=1 Tax=Herbiconiux sp. TaxID=1871186 RepID=UPI0025BF8398|nr:hypothetical protein [Herbiconiux sp.]